MNCESTQFKTFKRKKTPSDLRRNAARKAQFLDKKNLDKSIKSPTSTEETPTNQSPLTPPSSTEEPLPTPTTGDSSEIAEESPLIETAENISRDSTAASEIEAADMEVDQPPLLTSSPSQPKKDVPVSQSRISPAKPEELTQVNLLICAASKTAAKKRRKQFPNPSFLQTHESDLQPHESDKCHHFLFSIDANAENVSKMRSNINKFEDLLLLQVANEDKNIQPDGDDPGHCEQCKQSGI